MITLRQIYGTRFESALYCGPKARRLFRAKNIKLQEVVFRGNDKILVLYGRDFKLVDVRDEVGIYLSIPESVPQILRVFSRDQSGYERTERLMKFLKRALKKDYPKTAFRLKFQCEDCCEWAEWIVQFKGEAFYACQEHLEEIRSRFYHALGTWLPYKKILKSDLIL